MEDALLRPTGNVFVREELQLAVPVAVARKRLQMQLRADGLQAASAAALDHGRSGGDGSGAREGQAWGDRQVRGSGTVTRHTRDLSVHTLTAYTRGPVTVVPIRWFINGVGDGQPVLDANLEIGPAETTDTTLLLLVGLFRSITSRTDQGLHERSMRRIPGDLLTTVAALLALNPTSNGVKHPV